MAISSMNAKLLQSYDKEVMEGKHTMNVKALLCRYEDYYYLRVLKWREKELLGWQVEDDSKEILGYISTELGSDGRILVLVDLSL